MYANNTEETATVSGDDLVLGSATQDSLPFSATFTDGQDCYYVAKGDNGRVAGLGTYNESANSITRNDSWQYTSGGGVVNNPSSNLALTGTVIVRCDLFATSAGLQGIGDSSLVAEAANQTEQDAAIAAGSKVVVRTDLIPTVPYQLLLHFDGNNGQSIFVDNSVNAHAITAATDVITSTINPVIGTANLDTQNVGSGGLTIADDTSLRFGSQDFTVEFFFKLSTTATSNHHFFFSKGESASLVGWYVALLAGGNIMFAVDNNQIIQYDMSSVKNTTDWFHCSVNRIGTAWTMYIDGQQVASVTNAITISENTGDMKVGTWNYAASAATLFAVQMDEAAIVIGQSLRTGNFNPPIRALA